ncbi:MAG: alpha/beta fold hydrolase [Acidobacteria bacterium]|nr:alpha/beta fold hydrolase [Acidobacteriota bacterium]
MNKLRRTFQLALGVSLLLPILAAGAGVWFGRGILHPERRPLTQVQIAEADRMLERTRSSRTHLEVRATDGAVLRGWKIRPQTPNGDWVLLFHGVSDHRIGVLGHAEFLLRKGYSVLMMDARAHGASDGSLATYGWLERHDTRAIIEALYRDESVHCLFALGESMGAALALQSAAIEPRIAGVVAESSFSDLREVAYDYAGLHIGS